jgi:hypothetical protein
MSWPLTITCPELGRSMAAIIFSRVDLPAPEGPARNSSPLFTVNETSRSAVTSEEYCLETFRNSIIEVW